MHFYAEHSFYWLIPIAFFAFGVSYFLYHKQSWLEELSFKGWKPILMGLRFLTISIVCFLLLDIVIDSIQTKIQKPIIFSILDDSSSMDNYQDSLTVKSEVRSFDSILKSKFGERFEVRTLLVGDSVKENSIVSFKKDKSNLSTVFDDIYERYYGSNIGACILVSDGNFNEGMNPSYSVEKLVGVPVYTIGVGDSVMKRDQSISSIEANNVTYYKNKFPVKVTVESFRYAGKKSKVKIYRNGKLLQEELVQFENDDYSIRDINFLLEADEIGLIQYKVVIERLDGEYTYKNNTRFFNIEVVENRNKIILLSGAPHPDVTAIKSVLETDDKNDVKSVLMSEWKGNLVKANLVICHDPGVKFDPLLFETLEKEKIPVLIIVGLNTNQSVLNKIQKGTNFSLRYQTEEVQVSLNSDFQLFELSTELKELINQFPPLMIHFGQVNSNEKNSILLKQRVGNVVKNEPVLYFYNNNDLKSAMIYGEGIWRWKLTDYSLNESNALFTELMNKVVNYLMIQRNDSPLKIEFPKRIISSSPLFINASFYNASNELINSEQLSFTYKLKDEKNDLFFSKEGKSYFLDLGRLKPGVYEWKAQLKYNGKLHVKSGEFVVEKLVLEDLPTRTNVQVLNEVAVKSNAQFYWLKDANQLLDKLENEDSIAAIEYQVSQFDSLIDEKWILLLLILLISVEWFLRKWLGSY